MSPEMSLEEQKVYIEREKLNVEKQKTELLRKTYHIDAIGKIGIPLAVFVLALATYTSNKELMVKRLQFDIDTKVTEFRQKDTDLFLKKSESARAEEQIKNDFIQRNIAPIMSGNPEDMKRINALIQVTFSKTDADDVTFKINQLKQATTSAEQRVAQTNGTERLNYKGIGLSYFKQRNFEQAAANFETATLLNPSDAEAWNFKAYAQMKAGRLDDAHKSVATAISLRPADKRTRNYTVINGTKILCVEGRKSEAVTYINSALSAMPDLRDDVEKDGELRQLCGF